ncbi:hypothetical protein [Flagellimonas nanhaiensis]|uniref:hypothetical protein n=1 Tax=Flagellimonas nanhaiensis TaxID=2292706 RepID=UPI0015F24E19|nr:hypothetical protein [Allomuricauda nanhaiensis]
MRIKKVPIKPANGIVLSLNLFLIERKVNREKRMAHTKRTTNEVLGNPNAKA